MGKVSGYQAVCAGQISWQLNLIERRIEAMVSNPYLSRYEGVTLR
jgi:hypothetical protein